MSRRECLDDHGWCPGPDSPDPDPGAAWGGKCSECYLDWFRE